MFSPELALCLQHNQREMASAEGDLLLAGPGLKVVYVSSCFKGEGKTTAAVSLAMALAGPSNKRVLLIDGNSSSPRLHDLFSCSCSPGLAEFTTAEVDNDALFRTTENPNLIILPRGDLNDRREALKQLTAVAESDCLRERFDYIIVDGDSALGSSQVSLVVKFFDGVLLAVACERTKWEVVQQVKERIRQGGGQVLGVILNRRKYYIPRLFYGRK